MAVSVAPQCFGYADRCERGLAGKPGTAPSLPDIDVYQDAGGPPAVQVLEISAIVAHDTANVEPNRQYFFSDNAHFKLRPRYLQTEA
jgi:hypothetical protein